MEGMINIFTKKLKSLALGLVFAIMAQFIMMPSVYAWKDVLIQNPMSKGTLSGWSSTSYSTCEGYSTLDDTVKYSGTSSLKITNPSAFGNNIYLIANTSAAGLKAGKTYRYGAMVKAQMASTCTIYYQDIANTSTLTPLTNTYDWTKVELTYAPDKDGSLTIGFKCEDATVGLWVDDVFCYEYKDGAYVGKNLVANGNFDGTASTPAPNETQQGDVSETIEKMQEAYQKIRSSQSFLAEEIKPVMGAFKYMPLYYRDGIEIDGSLEDWDELGEITMPTNAKQYQTYIDTAEKDNVGKLKMAYDEQNLYIAVEVVDNEFVAYDNATYWKGDSLQLAIGSKDDSYGVEIGFVRNPDTGEGNVYADSLDDFDRKSIRLKTAQQGQTTTYEIAIPWAVRYGNLPEGILFDLLINDNDGAGRAYGLELAPGIAEGKSNEAFPYVELVGGKNDWYSWLEGSRSIMAGETNQYDFYLVNEGAEKSLVITAPDGQTKETVTVPQGSGIHRTYEMVYEDYGNVTPTVSVSYQGEEKKASIDVGVNPNAGHYTKMLEEIDRYINEIKGLLDKCENLGLPTDYEKIKYETMVLFREYMQQDIKNNFFIWFGYNYDCMVQIYKEAKEQLNAYLAGEKTPFQVPRYITSDVEFDGLVTTAMTDTNGVQERRPVFFIGYGHFNYNSDIISRVGGNIMQVGDHLNAVLKAGSGTETYTIQKSGYQSVLNLLAQAQETNVKIDYLLGIQAFPTAALTKYPELRVEEGSVKFNIMHKRAREALKFCIDAMIPDMIQYQSLNSICLYNEPSFSKNAEFDAYQPYWAAYLAEVHKGDIALLNKTYGSAYERFMDVKMPTAVEPTPRYYDWQEFNNRMFTDLISYAADCIHAIAPNLPVHVKTRPMSAAHDGAKQIFLGYGASLEQLAQVTEINGCDAHAYYNNSSWWLVEKEQMYDMLAGIKEAPIYNTEDHIIGDQNQYFGYEQADHVEGDLWQGAVHGRAGSVIWWWRRDYNPTNLSYGMWLNRPDCVEAVGRTQLDINRLSYEIAALANAKPNMAVLYSVTSRVYQKAMMNAMFNVYKTLLYNGEKVKFVSDTTSGEIFHYDTLFVPYASNVPAEVVENIYRYVQQGGKVVLLGKDCLKYNEHNNPNNSEQVAYILEHAEMVECATEGATFTVADQDKIARITRDTVVNGGHQDIQIMDVDTGKPAENIEYCSTEYEGKMIVNLCSYNPWGEQKNVKIVYRGTDVTDLHDLRKDVSVETNFVAEPELPVMVAFDPSEVRAEGFDDIQSHWAKSQILSMYQKGMVSGVGNRKFAPDARVTIAEFVAMTQRVLGMKLAPYTSHFKDITPSDWYSGNMQTAYETGMLNEIIAENSAFPNREITREEMCAVLVHAYEAVKGEPLADTPNLFIDIDEMGQAFVPYINKASAAGLIHGMGDQTFAPKQGATRAEAAVILSAL